MATFIDESGDAGPGTKSSRHFRLAAVWFPRAEDADAYSEFVRQLKLDMSIPQALSFHFTKLSHQQRLRFFNAIADLPFYFSFHNFDKAGFNRNLLTKEHIIESTITRMITCLRANYLKAATDGHKIHERVVFDRCSDQKYTACLNTSFNSISSYSPETAKFIKSVKPGKSAADVRIQLADMICGGTCRHIDGENTYFDIFRHRSMGIETIRE